ncbi:MAG: hypothetical protein ACK5TR_04155 [Alphaproteobacteria bacterium]|jgi:hypothetical protein|nr:hypothetical protein [Alphaproteobacteria bacterium]
MHHQLQVSGFELPEKAQADKGLVYVIYHASSSSIPSKLDLLFSPMDKDVYEQQKSGATTLLKMFTLDLLGGHESKALKRFAAMAPAHYTTLELTPGHYEFKCQISVPASIGCEPAPTLMAIEQGKTYFLIAQRVDYQVPTGTPAGDMMVKKMVIRHEEDTLKGQHALASNFNKYVHRPVSSSMPASGSGRGKE